MRFSSSARENWLGFIKVRRPTLYTLYVTPEELGALSVLSAIAASSSLSFARTNSAIISLHTSRGNSEHGSIDTPLLHISAILKASPKRTVGLPRLENSYLVLGPTQEHLAAGS